MGSVIKLLRNRFGVLVEGIRSSFSSFFSFGNGLIGNGVDSFAQSTGSWAVGVEKWAISEWVIRPSNGVVSGQVGKNNDSLNRTGVTWYLDNKLYIFAANGSAFYWGVTLDGAEYFNVPLNIIALFDSTEALELDKAKILVNGVRQILTPVGTAPATTTVLAPEIISIGGRVVTPSGAYDDDKKTEIGLWENNIPTEEEIAQIYNGGAGYDLRRLSTKPKFYYKTNEEDGATALIEVMQGANGVMNNYSTPPKYFQLWDFDAVNFGRGLNFNGVDTYADDIGLSLTGLSFGISFWMKSGGPQAVTILGGNQGNFNSIITQADEASIRIYKKTSGGGLNFTTFPCVYPAGEAVHLMMSYDGVNLSLYRNGIQTGVSVVWDGWDLLENLGYSNTYWDGALTEVCAVTNYAPTAQDALNLYNEGNGADARDVIAEASIARYYKTNEVNGATELVDTMGNQNATLNNFSGNYLRPWNYTALNFGNGLKTNGVDSVVNDIDLIWANPNLNAISFWIETTNDSFGRIFDNSEATANLLIFNNINDVRYYSSIGQVWAITPGLSANERAHILMVTDGANFYIYKNGVLEDSQAIANNIEGVTTFGARADTTQSFEMKITEVAFIDNYSVNAVDARDIYNNALSTDVRNVIDDSYIARYYKTNDEDGALTLVDTMGNKDATLTNFSNSYLRPWNFDGSAIDFDKRLVFDGTDDRATGVALSLDATSFGYSFWGVFYKSATYFNDGAANNNNSLYVAQQNQVRFYDSAATTTTVDMGMIYGEKAHWVFSFFDGDMIVYKNGVETANFPFVGWGSIGEIGSRAGILAAEFDITEFAICNAYSPSATDASNLYNNGLGGDARDILSGLERYYKTNGENGDATLIDEMGKQDVTLSNFTNNYFRPWAYAALDFDKRLAANNDTEYVSFDTITELNSATNISLHYWVQDNGAGGVFIIGSAASSTDRISIFKFTDDFLYFMVANGGNQFGKIDFTPWLGQKVLLSLVYNGGAVGNTERLKGYINGDEVTLTFGGTIPPSLSSTVGEDFRINSNETSSHIGNASYNEIVLTSTSNTAADVRDFYNNGDGTAASNVFLANVIENWKCNGINGDTTLVGNEANYEGTLNNFSLSYFRPWTPLVLAFNPYNVWDAEHQTVSGTTTTLNDFNEVGSAIDMANPDAGSQPMSFTNRPTLNGYPALFFAGGGSTERLKSITAFRPSDTTGMVAGVVDRVTGANYNALTAVNTGTPNIYWGRSLSASGEIRVSNYNTASYRHSIQTDETPIDINATHSFVYGCDGVVNFLILNGVLVSVENIESSLGTKSWLADIPGCDILEIAALNGNSANIYLTSVGYYPYTDMTNALALGQALADEYVPE